MMNSTDKICYIFGALEPGDVKISLAEGDLVVAADAGCGMCARLGLTPELVVGDFDSLGEIPSGDNVLRYPAEKDDTDVMLAVGEGLKRGFSRFALYGCLGGRLDHTLANVQILTFLSRRGCDAVLFGSDGSMITAVTDGEKLIDGAGAGRVSVFCAGERARGVCLEGFKYPLDGACLDCEYPLGVSNLITADRARVSVARGTLTIMIFPKEDIR